MELLVDGLEEVGPVLLLHLLAVVLHQGGQQFAVRLLVPLLAVVVEQDVLLLFLVSRSLYGHARVDATAARSHLVALAAPRLAPVVDGAYGAEALLVELAEAVEVQLAFQVARRVLPLAQAGLKLLLLLDESY